MNTVMQEIDRLRLERRAIVLAHNYQPDEIQDLADIVGDSFTLSKAAAESGAEAIVFCGVRFMAETAAILAPDKIVLLPAPDAGCPLAEMADPQSVAAAREKHPGAAVVAYVNTTAAVKAVSDYCCTSANAVRVVREIPELEVIFLPDQNLGHYVAAKVPEKQVIIWPGYCHCHHGVSLEDLQKVRRAYPDAPVLVHPECRPAVTESADFVGSTSQIIARVSEIEDDTVIIGTEMGILHQLRRENPGKRFFLLSPRMVCQNMKRTTLESVLACLRELKPRITVDEPARTRASKSLERMLAIGSPKAAAPTGEG